MRNIWTIFKTDIRTLSRCFFACVVVLAIALLPSLYAWLNIYSNWDPYGSTGGISIAVASLDRGYTDGGEYVNKGRDVLEDLKTATSINWVIVDTEKEATDGVCAGDYYAAVVIDEDFSRKMYRMFTDWNGRPAITYYENAKKNAVATKITDTAVETLKRSISENYLEVLIGGVMEQSNLLAADLTETDPETAVKGLLYQAQDVLTGCRGMMDTFRAAGGSGISSADAEALAAAIADLGRVRRDSLVQDPFCGSGTLVIEAAQKALNLAPGLRRRFAAEHFDFVPADIWAEQRQKALDEVRKDAAFEGIGYDIDPAAVALANANAKLAGVGDRCRFEVADVREFRALDNATVLTNPPYGERLGDASEAASLARTLGQVWQAHPAQGLYAITADAEFEQHFGKKAARRRKIYNGMIPCQLYMYFEQPKRERK